MIIAVVTGKARPVLKFERVRFSPLAMALSARRFAPYCPISPIHPEEGAKPTPNARDMAGVKPRPRM